MFAAESALQAAEAHDRAAARYERLAFHWMKRGKLPQAALASRQARLHLQTARFERERVSSTQRHLDRGTRSRSATPST
jgi:hypothetical protein